MKNSEHYAYVHAYPDATDASGIFYVGKGCGNRATDQWSRNSTHRDITVQFENGHPLIGIFPCSDSGTAYELEKGLMKRLRAMGAPLVNRRVGGGARGYEVSEETRIKISVAHKRIWKIRPSPFLGRKHTSETIEKMRQAKLGKIASEEARVNMSLAHKGKIHKGMFVNGYRHSDEVRKKMSEARRGVKKTGQGLENIRLGCAARKGEKRSLETCANISAARLAQPIVDCPHCGITGRRGGGMTRFHFDNCKSRGE